MAITSELQPGLKVIMLAIIEAYRAGLLDKKHWLPNITAGLIVGVVALPLAMAFAIASGVKPEQGIYTAIVAAVLVGIFGGSRVQIAGPTGAFIVILAHVTAQYGVEGLQTATMLAGIILILMGVMKLGNVIKFIPDPVIVGFTTGIGFIIFAGEWKDFFGLTVNVPLSAHFYEKLLSAGAALPDLNPATTALAVMSLLVMIISPRIFRRLPGPLIAMLAATSLQMIFKFQDVATIGSAFGGIPQHLPTLQFPTVTWNKLIELIGPAFSIALLGAIESLLSASAADGMAGTRHHSNQELIGQGLANMLAPLFGGFAATGAIARTATNIRNGGSSPLSALTHSIFLVLVILLLAPLAVYIPLCTLAAILFVVAYNMSDLPHFVHIIKCAPRYDVVVLLTTFILTVFTDLIIAVNAGVLLAMLFFIRRSSETAGIAQETPDNVHQELKNAGIADLPADTVIYSIQGPLFFGVAEKIEHALAVTHNDPQAIIFRLRHVPFMDMTGLETFSELLTQYHHRGIRIYLCEASANVCQKLANIGILQLVDGKRVYLSLPEAARASQTPEQQAELPAGIPQPATPALTH
ncbi:C4-dicarboxylic acid transporter DauA [Aquicella siphonis]|uniref:C4-dicarboxylic acid transporter DauA n=1 Tax=Aquicella siphonis TaxID=254247 RepID=A0A5E4PGB3_9COXI|nr:SulP family inorganic anion transporter [Aquicella siphonis]VVC75675.1 C4-dicarboxylic acid transporter DauA [Aquicella siphonis]